MPVFKSPFSSRTHVVPEYMEDYILNNSETKERVTQNEPNNDVLTQTGWNWNTNSTKKDNFNDITLRSQQLKNRTRKWNKRIYGARKWKNG